MTLEIDWTRLRMRWEAGETSYSLSKDLGGTPSKQGIDRRAKTEGWQRGANAINLAEQLPLVQRAKGMAGFTKRTPEVVGTILQSVAQGATLKLAAQSAGVSPDTLRKWQAEDPAFKEQLRICRAGKLVEWLANIDAMARTDWRASKALLDSVSKDEADELGLARDEPQKSDDKGVTIVLNIDRAGEPTEARIVSEQ